MKTKNLTKIAASAFIFAAICTMAAMSGSHQTADTQAAPWYSIVPPLMAIMLAFLTRNVILSIAVSIIVGGLLTTLGSGPTSLIAIFEGLKTAVLYPVSTVIIIDGTNEGNTILRFAITFIKVW